MIDRLVEWDTSVFWWINSHHNTALDWILWTASQGWSWAIVIVGLMLTLTRKLEPKRWWVVALCIGGCFLLGDRISVMCFKDVVCRLRPCHELEGVRMFLTKPGGLYSFVSSHATNICALAMMFFLRYKGKLPRQKSIWLGIAIWTWALLVMYSRPYLGKHYPGDVICGGILGIGIGALIHYVSNRLENRRKIIEKK